MEGRRGVVLGRAFFPVRHLGRSISVGGVATHHTAEHSTRARTIIRCIRLAAQPALKIALQDGSACNHTTRLARPRPSSGPRRTPSKEGF